MAKFKIGDKVRILDGSYIRNYYGNWVPGMKKFVGREGIIKGIASNKKAYWVEGIDINDYIFDERGLELVENNQQNMRYPLTQEDIKNLIKNQKITAKYMVKIDNKFYCVQSIYLDNGEEVYLQPYEVKETTTKIEIKDWKEV